MLHWVSETGFLLPDPNKDTRWLQHYSNNTHNTHPVFPTEIMRVLSRSHDVKAGSGASCLLIECTFFSSYDSHESWVKPFYVQLQYLINYTNMSFCGSHDRHQQTLNLDQSRGGQLNLTYCQSVCCRISWLVMYVTNRK